MYHQAYGILETLAPLHVGASAGEETGNLNLIFRDQFTQTGIIPGSSLRGRFRADLRQAEGSEAIVNQWYGHAAVPGQPDGGTTEALVKFEYASIVWLPVFCPGQPVVWVSCPRLLKRYQKIAKLPHDLPLTPYTTDRGLSGISTRNGGQVLFFNLGWLELKNRADLSGWIPEGTAIDPHALVIVADNDIALLHDMALYRQSRVRLKDDMKKVDGGGFFNLEALPEGTILVFPIALKEKGWRPFGEGKKSQDLYFGGLESIGLGRCSVTLSGDYQ